MLEKIQFVKPEMIEARSMEMITKELKGRTWPEPEFSVVKRCIHTSADFDYADNLCFSEGAAALAVEALKKGVSIVTDTRMAASGINKRRLAEYGGEVHCFIDAPDVAEEARERGCTRAAVCMERAAALRENLVIAVGNAPTALIRLYELIQAGEIQPVLIVGAPVGFVNVVEAKELIMTAGVPFIVPKGRKGGSNIAAAVCNALLYQ
ncbi:MAG: precorrin-8X methylmutase [Lachnospiraceae bacterium]|nr:precorrin-8X methylmutase [Lachnospiraceae bacterium]